jgi:hypothetical protein
MYWWWRRGAALDLHELNRNDGVAMSLDVCLGGRITFPETATKVFRLSGLDAAILLHFNPIAAIA